MKKSSGVLKLTFLLTFQWCFIKKRMTVLLLSFCFLLDTKEGRGEGGARQVMIEVQPDTWKKTKRHPSKIKKENNDVRQ